jgi:hypothetical protein
MNRAAYRDARAAVTAAYDCEAGEVIKRASTEKGSPSHGLETPYERFGQAGIAMRVIRESLGERIEALDAKYTNAKSLELAERKLAALERLTNRALQSGEIYGEPDPEYTKAAMEAWAGLGRLRGPEWADRLGVSTRALRWWRHGRPGWGKGITEWADREIDEALVDIEGPLQARGIIP